MTLTRRDMRRVRYLMAHPISVAQRVASGGLILKKAPWPHGIIQWASVGVQNDSGQGSRSFSICNYSGKAATVVGYDSSWGN